MIKSVALIALLLTAPVVANGQSRGFVGAGFGSSSFGATRYTNAIEPGRLSGFVADAGFWGRKRLGLGVEVWVPLHRRAFTQQFNYDILIRPYRRVGTYREETVVGLLLGRLNRRESLSAIWVIGGGLVTQGAIEQYSDRAPGSSEFGPFGPLQHTTGRAIGLTGGLELAIEMVRRVSVVPQFRVLVVPRNYLKNSITELGLDRVMTRIGVSVRATF